ncbi:MAG: DEAD/DEAH box helicase family protein [Desulfovibrio sp.]|nr:DEAD/DEAH box helicase family protein [Desulfovibrio sp.]
MDKTQIRPNKIPGIPLIYAYTLPGVEYLRGKIKIGQTNRDPEQRIAEQTKTAGIRPKLEWDDYAVYRDGAGEIFTDKDFHAWLVREKNIEQEKDPETGGLLEIFPLDGPTSHAYFGEFARRDFQGNSQVEPYTLRAEQEAAVKGTVARFEREEEDSEYLWNAKPRFGKTLTSYALIERMGFDRVLIVSNRPGIANAWAEDYDKFIRGKGEYAFVSDNDALKGKPGVLTREQYQSARKVSRKMIAFESLQGLKGSLYFGGDYDKLKWIKDLEFDLLIVDESHEGVDTYKTERAFDHIKREHTLYLSGTPFRQLASGRFEADQIYNWSYADEQAAKENWAGPEPNPYERLPKLNLFTYQMSEIIRDKAKRGIVVAEGEDAVDYAFDLNEFFKTDSSGKFEREEDVKKFVRALTRNEKYPFSSPELRKALAHTMWYMDRVASAKALKKLLEEDEVFREYKIILAAGDGDDGARKKAYNQVKDAVAKYDKTITLTVGQLTVGVTIPEWSAVLMLCNLSSPAAYMQAAFRAQNPWRGLEGEDLVMKENAYVFDFDPARTLTIYDEFANNIDPGAGGGTSEDRERRVKKLLNFLPVIGEDDEGRMVELDATRVLTIPARLKSRAVVERGFMSNFLFKNLGAIFAAPAMVRRILDKLPVAQEEKRKEKPEELDKIKLVPVDENGEIDIPDEKVIGQSRELFGEKIYGYLDESLDDVRTIVSDATKTDAKEKAAAAALKITEKFVSEIATPLAEANKLKNSERKNLAKKIKETIDDKLKRVADDCERAKKIAEAEYARNLEKATDESGKIAAKEKRDASLNEADNTFSFKLEEAVKETWNNAPADLIKEMETMRANNNKKSSENEIRARLRGFARTIPSFIMAYGDENLQLANFENYVSDEVFREATGISIADFVFLRDGGEYRDEETGKTENFAGGVFDETVFDDSIREFLAKKKALADYFDENQKEDIFDYIPQQKNNQVFTPREVVMEMVDAMERENPGCFDDPARTFADLYMKSGLYIAEIIKRLYRSDGLKKAYPYARARLAHILEKQVYGMAPSEIIYRIATNFILGFTDESMRHNFRLGDAMAAVKDGKLRALIDAEYEK